VARPRNWSWLAARLEDPGLLRRGVVVLGEIAVPVGGKRRGGFVFVAGRAEGKRVIAAIRGVPGFPRPRLVVPRRYAATVRWGDAAPVSPGVTASDLEWARHDLAAGRYHGYTERAIRRFLVQGYGEGIARAAMRRVTPSGGPRRRAPRSARGA